MSHLNIAFDRFASIGTVMHYIFGNKQTVRNAAEVWSAQDFKYRPPEHDTRALTVRPTRMNNCKRPFIKDVCTKSQKIDPLLLGSQNVRTTSNHPYPCRQSIIFEKCEFFVTKSSDVGILRTHIVSKKSHPPLTAHVFYAT